MKNVFKYSEVVEDVINKYLPEEEGYSKVVKEAMNYSVKGSGKRIRPLIMYLSYSMCGGKNSIVEPFMAAIEMIHSYSLVHDDLPAMDNDTLRRGKPTTWCKYGEDIAILAGDGLLNYAYETSLKAYDYSDNDSYKYVVKAQKILTEKSGIYGMIGGQTLDVVSNGENLNIQQLEYIHHLKTCALIEASLMIGGTLAGMSEDKINKLCNMGYNLGMAFQIQDDILDVIGNEEEIGKPVKSDEKNQKTTYVTLYGLDKAKEYVEKYSNLAIDELQSFPDNEYRENLKQLFVMLINRNR